MVDKVRTGLDRVVAATLLSALCLSVPMRDALAQSPFGGQGGAGEGTALVGVYTGEVGIAFRGASLDVQKPGSDLVLTTMESALRPSLTLNVQAPSVYFGDWPVGYVLRYGLDFFSTDTQDTPFTFDQEDLGTSVDGFFLYFMPTLVFDATRLPGPDRPGGRFGIGFGVGFLSAKGDFLYWDLETPYGDPGIRGRIDVSSLATGGYLFAEYLLGRLVFGMRVGMFNASGGGYDYLFSDYSLDVGWRSRF